MENNRLWAGLFVLFMYEQPAPSGGEWTPENNAFTDWCREFLKSPDWMLYWQLFDVVDWLLAFEHFDLMKAFDLSEKWREWRELNEKWHQRIMQCERIKRKNSKNTVV